MTDDANETVVIVLSDLRGARMSTPAQRMVAEQLRPHGVTDERVLEAMASVPREEFLHPRMRRHAYEDRALAIDCGQTISQPLVVALMTQAASPQPEDVALEVGTGSGYAAAVLSRLCRKVITIEREPALAEHASQTLQRLGFDNVEVAVGDGSLGWPAEAPYQVVLVAAAAPGVPPALIDQLAEGGRLVIPVEVSPHEPQDLRVYTRLPDGVGYRSLFPVLFVPLRPG
jgi:protein-L-isoaspartate(D-aspartate) O-methyltransferase